MEILGYQVSNYETGEHWNDRPSYEILTQETAIKELDEATLSGTGLYQMTAITEGMIEEPTFEDGRHNQQ